ncbi:RNA pseudouridine synthase [uncultured Desulfovibrio sp.]|uniref:pseudouridine synthase family protein n=1 Tax=uncultured Desulfovibrio sp. TaxID=167968 RepID=UPI0026072DCA|nr:RNA pseudouridine synthase [uncultured Desulfovibrio sp.]
MPARELRVDAALAGQRLDHALAALMPELGLRGRRRLIARNAVLVGGRAASAARRLRPGELITLHHPAAEGKDAAFPIADKPRLLSHQGEYCFLYKPAGLHSAALAGGGGSSLEAALPALLASLPDGGAARLLQRLDYGTSGIVCAALTQEAVLAFRRAEREGQCEKRYLALLRGILVAPATVRAALDTADRRQIRLLAPTDDSGRWTEFLPLHVWEDAASLPPELAEGSGAISGPAGPFGEVGLTLAACRIRCGARHQIRAHAAALGHPLRGDDLYGPASAEPPAGAAAPARFFSLHHGALLLPGVACVLPPSWPLPEAQAEAVRKWLESPPQCGILGRGQRAGPDPQP